MSVHVDYDETIPALYIQFCDKPYAFGEDLDDQRRIDYAEDRTPIGVELLYLDLGIDLKDLPQADEVADVLRQYGVRTLV